MCVEHWSNYCSDYLTLYYSSVCGDDCLFILPISICHFDGDRERVSIWLLNYSFVQEGQLEGRAPRTFATAARDEISSPSGRVAPGSSPWGSAGRAARCHQAALGGQLLAAHPEAVQGEWRKAIRLFREDSAWKLTMRLWEERREAMRLCREGTAAG